jgi:hypothetical protein
MRMRCRNCLCGAGLILSMARPMPGYATTVYDGGGFESPRFSTGNLDGQDEGLWVESGGAAGGTATVEGTSSDGGTQAVMLTRVASSSNGGDKRYWPNLPVFTPTSAQSYINVNWDMNVTATHIAGVTTGPFFGIEAYDPNVNLIAAAGVDATTGEILFADPTLGGGFNSTTADATVALNTWNHFELAMNFTTDMADIYVNGTLVQEVQGFDSPGITQFSDADLSTVATYYEPPTQTGSAVFDNYTVTSTSAVPEPASVGFLILGSLCTLGRRNKLSRHV